MAKGYVKWICKVEGKEVPEKPKFKAGADYLCFPGEISDPYYLREIIDEVLEVGAGGQLENTLHLVYYAFPWSSHPLHWQWCTLSENGYITEEIYECCTWMDFKWDEAYNQAEDYVDPDYDYDVSVCDPDDEHWSEAVDW